MTVNRTRNHQIKVRVNDAELALIKEKIRVSGLSQQEYIIRALKEQPITITDNSALKKIIPELKRQGNNLNQLTKKMNIYGQVDSVALEKLAKELEAVWQQLRQYTQNHR